MKLISSISTSKKPQIRLAIVNYKLFSKLNVVGFVLYIFNADRSSLKNCFHAVFKIKILSSTFLFLFEFIH